jgi:hypothetical protein
MNLTVEIPADLAGRLSATGGDLSRRALEAFAAEEYKRERLTRPELQRLLGLETSVELIAFFRAADIRSEHTRESQEFDAKRAQAAGAKIRELRSGVRLDRQGVSIRELAHRRHKY